MPYQFRFWGCQFRAHVAPMTPVGGLSQGLQVPLTVGSRTLWYTLCVTCASRVGFPCELQQISVRHESTWLVSKGVFPTASLNLGFDGPWVQKCTFYNYIHRLRIISLSKTPIESGYTWLQLAYTNCIHCNLRNSYLYIYIYMHICSVYIYTFL